MSNPLIYNCDLKTWKKKLKKKLKNERLNFENPIFRCFLDFLQNFVVNDFLKSFVECLTRFWVFSFLKIIFRHWIWNEIRENLEQNVALKLFFVCSFEMDFWCMSLFFWHLLLWNVFVVFVALRMFLGRLSLWKYFLALFSLKIVFWHLSLRKCFFALVALKIIFCSCCCENYFWPQSF